MNKIAVALMLVTLTAAAPAATAHAAKPRVAPAFKACQATLETGDLSVFGSPSTAERNRLGDLIVPNSGQIPVNMVAGAFVDGTPGSSRAVYAVVPSAGLRYFDQ